MNARATLQPRSRLKPARRRAAFFEPVLSGTDPLVAEHAREELGALGGSHRRHHGQLLLAGEVGVEELLTGHAEETRHPLGDGAERVGDRRRISILIEFGVVQRAKHTIVARPKGELHLHLDLGAGWRAAAADGLPAPAGGRHPVHCPGDRLENRGLAGAIGPDDAGQSRSQLQLGVLMLAEVAEADSIDLHQTPARSRSTVSINSSPRRTKASRSSSAGRRRRIR